MTFPWHRRPHTATSTVVVLTAASILAVCDVTGCARVALEGGDKPIHIVMDINVKVDRELDQFFDFQKKFDATAPTSQSTAN